MRNPILAMFLAAAPAVASPLGLGLPDDARPADDWPFGVEVECAQLGEEIWCVEEGLVVVVHTPIAGPVEGPVVWRRTAGLEWRSGSLEVLAVDHVRWASLSGGWESRGAVPVQIERELAPTLSERLAGCAVHVVDMPVELLFDDSGVARLVRLQGFPDERAGDLDCLAWAVGVTPFAGESRVELTVTTSPPPPDAASPGTSRTPQGP
ncbi:MAG: hypothetical protein GY913_20450 [Proteobacteria bacterium]|nr:hypothetical protein [Pseudomonadota bacterium]MCP4919279.1 hypothetical protein [Pseudomonadota bacterium]